MTKPKDDECCPDVEITFNGAPSRVRLKLTFRKWVVLMITLLLAYYVVHQPV